ncbi:unnamed protein product [Lactuca virosa]|uniref:Beta-glucosidase n=1 Tax=Lactuca virosa TaxID=75947 RepID=A0AAU9MEW2_9ASTR|nr:unnamed protein product [Lactuca virosa]
MEATLQKGRKYSFPNDITSADFEPGFVWGTATSAYQIEGAVLEGGRQPSVWDTFCLTKSGAIDNEDNGNNAINAYYKTKEDVQLMKKLGLKAYRFSFSWSRILPGGKLRLGINQEGVDYYNNLIDELKRNEIEPFVTLWHWDTPNALEEDYLGFLDKQIIDDFADYAEFCFWEFGDRVKHWITLNEPHSYASSGYGYGIHAPGRGGVGDAATEPYIVAHNLLLAHATAADIYKKGFQESQGGVIGITLNQQFNEPLNQRNLVDQMAADRAMDFIFGWYMEPLFSDSNVHQTEVGLNGELIGPEGGVDWFFSYPLGIYKSLMQLKDKYGNPLVYITENGYADAMDNKLKIEEARIDNERIVYYNTHLQNVLRAIGDGCNVKGYFAWSMMDNFEWHKGYSVRFGLFYVDYTHGKYTRYPKHSAIWFKKFLNPPAQEEKLREGDGN